MHRIYIFKKRFKVEDLSHENVILQIHLTELNASLHPQVYMCCHAILCQHSMQQVGLQGHVISNWIDDAHTRLSPSLHLNQSPPSFPWFSRMLSPIWCLKPLLAERWLLSFDSKAFLHAYILQNVYCSFKNLLWYGSVDWLGRRSMVVGHVVPDHDVSCWIWL